MISLTKILLCQYTISEMESTELSLNIFPQQASLS